MGSNDEVYLETKNVIVGILKLEDIKALRKQFGGLGGVDSAKATTLADLRVPIYDNDLGSTKVEDGLNREATQHINPDLWPMHYHFKGDPVVPGNFGTHGMISLLKASAKDDFGLKNPIFKSMTKKSFSGMIFEDEKQIRFVLEGISQSDSGDVIAKQAALYLEDTNGNKLIDTPIYTFKNLTVVDS